MWLMWWSSRPSDSDALIASHRGWTAIGFAVIIGIIVVETGLPVRARAADNGRDIALNGNGRGAHACSSCHGTEGEGRPQAGYPRLAALSSNYIERQLKDFADKSRDNDLMHPIAKSLSPSEIQTVAGYYASLTAPKAEEPKPLNDGDIALGKALADNGNWSSGLPACGQCHGPSGQGVGKSFPRLAGQGYSYLLNQLKAWKSGNRSNDPLNLMTGVVSKLDDKQINAVAAYFASLPTTPQPGGKP